MGEVYLATDDLLERQVAVKALLDRYATDDVVRRRFLREALAAARLSGHRHVVTVYDVGEHDGRPFIVMAYMAGGSVEQRLRHTPPPPPSQALDWLEQAGAALDVAHREGIVHRDVKPGNLLLDDGDTVHVGDFGIARAAGLDSLTSPGTLLGTAGYLSPEQAAGMSATGASDRYALGIVAFELLAGRRPFASESPTVEAIAHADAPIPSAHDTNPGLPRAVDHVFDRALAKSPEARPASCDELVAELRGAFWQAEAPTGVLRVPSRETEAMATVVRPARRRRKPLLLAAGGIAAACVGAAVGLLATSGGGGVTVTRVTQRTVASPVSTPTTAQKPKPTPAARTPAAPVLAPSASRLNDDGFARLRGGDAQGALPLLERAVTSLRGSGTITEAYASYNLAWARFAVGRCDGVLGLLDRSEELQGRRKEIDRLRKQVEHRCETGARHGHDGDEQG